MRRLKVMVLVLAACAPGVALGDGKPDQVLALVNKERARAGCDPLVADPRLVAAAQGHSDAMARLNFMDHVGADGSDPGQRAEAQGFRWSTVGENIAAGQPTASDAVRGWLKSRGHRANIRNCAFTHTGIAVTFQADDKAINGNSAPFRTYWTQLFARPAR